MTLTQVPGLVDLPATWRAACVILCGAFPRDPEVWAHVTPGEQHRLMDLVADQGRPMSERVLLAAAAGLADGHTLLPFGQLVSLSDSRLRLVLVPRHPERFDSVARLLVASGLPWVRRTELMSRPAGRPILLVDTVGELGAWWGAAQIAFVGGSFGRRGGQNMIEPAAYGAAVCFGPNTWNFRIQLPDGPPLDRAGGLVHRGDPWVVHRRHSRLGHPPAKLSRGQEPVRRAG